MNAESIKLYTHTHTHTYITINKGTENAEKSYSCWDQKSRNNEILLNHPQ